MKMTRVILLSVIAIVFLSIASVNAEDINEKGNAGLTYSISDDANILNSDASDFSALSDEIESSSENIIILTKDYSFDPQKDSNYTNGIPIEVDNLVIDGQNHTIDAKNKFKAFLIKSSNVTLRNINIINGYSVSDGGAVNFLGDDGSVINSNFKFCNSNKYGGAVSFKTTGTVINSNFENNKAGTGGAVDFGETGEIRNSTFKNNYAKFQGGAISFYGESTVNKSTFINNTGGDGGVIYCEKNCIIDNSTFTQNCAIGYGGGIYFMAGGVVTNSRFEQNTAFLEGGAIIIKSGNLNINNSIFYCNNAKNGNSLYIISTVTSLENLSFENENAKFDDEIFLERGELISNNISFKNKTIPSENPTKPTANVIVKKKTSIRSSSKTFKAKKTKKITAILKSGKKLLKSKRIRLTIKGKTYTKKTNKLGKAIFKIKLTKKGKYKARIRFNGDKYYKASTKTITIKIK